MLQAEERKAVRTQIMNDKHTKCGTTVRNNNNTLMAVIYLQRMMPLEQLLD